MFQSTGFFQGIDCPYFATGLCERPNCHYSHRPVQHRPVQTYPLLTVEVPKRLGAAGDSSEANSSVQSVTPYATSKSSHEEKQTYKPSPKSGTRTATILRPTYEHASYPTGPSTMVYKPTPIAELKARPSTKTQSATAIEQETPQRKSSNCSLPTIPSYNTAEAAIKQMNADSRLDRVASTVTSDIHNGNQSTGSKLDEETSATDQRNASSTVIIKKEKESSNADRIWDTPSKTVHEDELNALFGEDSSDEEELNLSRLQSNDDEFSDGGCVVIEPPPKRPDSVIDLTLDSEEEEDPSDIYNKHKTATSDDYTTKGSTSSEIIDNQTRNTKTPTNSHRERKKSSEKKNKHHKDKDKKSCHDKEHKSSRSKEKEYSTQKSKEKLVKKRTVATEGLTSEDQCKSLFQSFHADPKSTTTQSAAVKRAAPKEIPEEENQSIRKRVARELNEEMRTVRNAPTKRAGMPSATQVMEKRIQHAKNNPSPSKSISKPGLTHCSAQRDKEKYLPKGITSAQTSKHTARKAHIPVSMKMQESLERPRIVSNNSKVPCNVRNDYLSKLIGECEKLYPEKESAYSRAQHEELTAFDKSTSRKVYLNVIINAIKRIRNEQSGTTKLPPMTSNTHKVSHEKNVLAGRGAGNITVGLKRRASHYSYTIDDIHGDLFFKKLRQYVLTEEELIANGFPRPDPQQRGRAVIRWPEYDKKKMRDSKGSLRTCDRCGKPFHVTSDGHYLTKEECVFHFGKLWDKRVAGQIDRRYSCCEEKLEAEGCASAPGHTHSTNKYEDMSGYMQTLERPNTEDHCVVLSLDCEMVNTTAGIELARVTVIDDKLNIIYDAIVKPANEIIDYNTRFSGLKEEDFIGCDTSLKDVQAILLDMIQADTVLMGHSLNSDLIALKLIHSTVVDTSAVWPHNRGLPFKKALRTLMVDILQKIIQNAGDAGHDSSEDAKACMELMKWKVLQDVKKDMR